MTDRNFRLIGWCAPALLAGLVSGCALGPDYRTPPTQMAGDFENATGDRQEPPREFWRRFDDPVLNGLVDDALKANHDIRIAVANLRAARAVQLGVDAQAWPQVGSNASATRQIEPQSFAPGFSRNQRTLNNYDVSMDANWELNLFGRFTRASESAAASVSAAQAGVAAAQVSVTAEVARNYFELRGQQLRLQIAQQSLQNQQANLDLVQARLDAGRGTELDTTRAQSQLESTRAQVPVLQAGIELSRYRLAVLTGRPPTELASLSGEIHPLPGLKPVDGIGTPADLLRRRPDIRVAERQLAAATADIGASKADLFPSVSITGLLGLNALTPGGLNSGQAYYYNLGASMAWTVLDFGRIRARIRQNEARADAALAQYEKTVLTALEETEGALISFDRNQRRAESLFKAARASEQADELARARFEAGVTDFLNVLDAERQLLADRDGLAQAQTDAGTSLVAVYRALGGGWYQEQQAATTVSSN
ncbi:MAG TPA: efflux transporter outer membrane subunit [Burkholderiaceae bacterium]|jgi:multidrug efflux system outer membrane protein|nr:efflux transporter outer membrane subunit [Burkholderiaceae bacterium]